MRIRYTSTVFLFLILSVLVVSDNNDSEEATGAELHRNHHRHLAGKGGGRTWCIASRLASDEKLKANIKFCCRNPKVDCTAIQKDRKCYEPPNSYWHASYATNQYYQAFGKSKRDCNFGGTAIIVDTNPSTPNCTFTG